MTLLETLRKAEAALQSTHDFCSGLMFDNVEPWRWEDMREYREGLDALMMLRAKIEWLELTEKE